MALILSDYNAGSAKASNVARAVPYTDLDIGLTILPKTADIIPLYDIDAIKNAVKILVLTNFYERPFAPFKGANLTALLFEPADIFTANQIKREIERVIEEYEPRVNSVLCEVTPKPDENYYSVSITFNVVNFSNAIEVNFYLKRIR
jgi:phage baseplate assembly protein W